MSEEAADCTGNVGWGRLYAGWGGCGVAGDDAAVSGGGVIPFHQMNDTNNFSSAPHPL
ncbi:hypothetical protein [Fortiea sp. LEGE XX443]|uniref:hypothetical protein n=1 Tax=Fortiea sp. LEGE XX443 TaxID=1828611 RepID=UPI0030DC7103